MQSNQKCKFHNANKQIFLYFRYKEKKMQGLNNNFTSRPYYKQNKNKPNRIPRSKHSNQCARTTNEKNDKKEIRQKIQQQKGFLSLCRHLRVRTGTQEDLATNQTHPANTKLNQQD
jgi:hypothetical protein